MSTITDSICSSESTDTYVIFDVTSPMNELEESTSEKYARNGWGNDSSSTIAEPVNPEYIVFPIDDFGESYKLPNEVEIKILKETEEWMSKLQKTDKKKDKLARLTGRRNSIEKISPFLISETSEEAIKNGNLVLRSDHIKQKIGERPNATDICKPNLNFEKGRSDDLSTQSNGKINKICKIFGRPDSIGSIAQLLQTTNPNEAIQHSIKMRKMEKLKKLAGV